MKIPCIEVLNKWIQHLKETTWLRVSLLLCIFGFLKDFRPSEPFVYEFLIGEWRNLTEEQVSTEAYPVSIYCFMGFQLLVLLITDICRYKAIVLGLGVCGIVTWSLFLWTTSLLGLQFIEVSEYF